MVHFIESFSKVKIYHIYVVTVFESFKKLVVMDIIRIFPNINFFFYDYLFVSELSKKKSFITISIFKPPYQTYFIFKMAFLYAICTVFMALM